MSDADGRVQESLAVLLHPADRSPARWLPAIRAIAAMQLRGWLNVTRRGLRSDPLPTAAGIFFQLGSVAGSLALTAGFFFLMVIPLDDDPGTAGMTSFWVATGAIAMMSLMALLAGVSGDGGDLPEATRFQIFPLEREKLLVLDLVSELLSPTLVFFLLPMSGLALGSMIHGFEERRPLAAILSPVAVAIAFLASGAIVRSVIGFVSIGGRRIREAIGVLLMLVFLGFAMSGQIVQDIGEGRLERIGRLLASLFRLTHAGTLGSFVSDGSYLALAGLVAWAAAALALQRRVTGRILDGQGGFRPKARTAHRSRIGALLGRLLPAPVLGVATADFRTLTRMPTMWALLFLPAIFGFMLSRPGLRGDSAGESFLLWLPALAALGAHFLFSWQIFCNVFGTDHAGIAQIVLSPIRAWQVLLGKALSRWLFGSAQMLVFLAVLSMRLRTIGRSDLALAFLAWSAASLWVSAVGGLLSIRIPFRVSHGIRREKSLRGIGALAGQMVVGVVLVPPALMILGGRALRGDGGYEAGIAVTALAGLALWALSTLVADDLLERRTQDLVSDLTGGL